MQQRPALASHIAQIVALSAALEQSIAMVLVAMTGLEVRAAVLMYFSIVNYNARVDCLRSLAKRRLDAELLAEFEESMRLAKSSLKERNTIVHGIWGWADSLPNALILSDASDLVSYFSNVLYSSYSGQSLPETDYERRRMVYKESDFIHCETRLQEADLKARHLADRIRYAMQQASRR